MYRAFRFFLFKQTTCLSVCFVSACAQQVVEGLINVVAVSLSTLNQQMSQTYIVKHQLPPMLELEMHLSGGKVGGSCFFLLFYFYFLFMPPSNKQTCFDYRTRSGTRTTAALAVTTNTYT